MLRSQSCVVLVAVLGTLLGGCSTKNFGRMQPLSAQESAMMDCDALRLEVGRVEAFLQGVDTESQVDIRSVGAFLGDFGIGNSLEKNAAVKSANSRLAQLRQVQYEKGCYDAVPPAPMATAPPPTSSVSGSSKGGGASDITGRVSP